MELGIRTAKIASFVTFGKFFSLLINSLMFILVARLLGPSNYGIYVLLFGISGFMSSFGYLSTDMYFNEQIRGLLLSKERKGIGIILVDVTLVTLLAGLILVAIGVLLSSFISSHVLHSTTYMLLVDIALSSIVFSFLYSTFNAILIGLNDGKNSAIGSLLSATLQAVLSVGLILLGFGIAGAITGFVLGYALAAAFEMFIAYRDYGVVFRRSGFSERAKAMLRFSVPLTLSRIINNLVNNFSVILLGLVALPSLVGQYGVASRIGNQIDIVAYSIGLVLLPMFAEAKYNKKTGREVSKLFSYSIYFGLLFTAPIAIFVTVFSRDIIITLFKATYSGSVLYMRLISIGMLLGIISTYASQLIISTKRQAKILKYTIIIGLIQTLLLLVFVPPFKVTGLIISLLYMGNLVSLVLYFNYTRGIGIKTNIGQLARLVIANAAVGAVLAPLLLLNWLIPIRAVIGLALLLLLYPPIVIKLKAITTDEIGILHKVGLDIPVLGRMLQIFLRYAEWFESV